MAQDIKITSTDIIIALFSENDAEALSIMPEDELREKIQDIEEEMYAALVDEQVSNEMYGDPDHEEYLMSESYEADVKAEQWDWLKNEEG